MMRIKYSAIPVLTLTALLLLSHRGNTQTGYDISIVLPENVERFKNAPDMLSALKVLQKCTDHSFVIEGMPLHNKAVEGAFKKIDLPQGKVIHAEALIQEVARIYDYSLVEKGKVYIFYKKFTDPDDFPEITGPELRTFLRNVAITANRFSTNIANPQGVNANFLRFAKSLSAEDTAQLNFGESQLMPRELLEALEQRNQTPPPGTITVETPEEYQKLQDKMMRFSAIKPEQQQFFKQMAFSEFVGKPIGKIREGIALMYELETAETNFLWKERGPVKSPLYFVCTRKVSPERTYQTTLQKGPVASDTDAPKTSDYDADGKPWPRNVETENTRTLGELCIWLNQNRKGGPELAVTPALASKRITFLDPGTAAKETIWNAVAGIYNLSLTTGEGKLTLTIPEVQSCATWEEASRQIEAIFPGPLLRFCQTVQVNIERREIARMRKGLPEDAPVVRVGADDVMRGMGELRWRIIARLRIQLEPRAKAAKDQILPWAELTEEEKQWTQFILAFESVPIAYKLAYSGLPAYIKNPNDCIVSGRVFESQGRTFLRVAIRTPDGTAGISSMAMIEGLKKEK